MADEKRLILGVGDIYNIENFKEYFEIAGEDRIVFGGEARNVTEAINEINGGNYWGVFMSSLALSSGIESKKYNIAAKKFEKFDGSPYIFCSGGLYVVEQACDKGLVTVVNAISEGGDVLAEAERLGAKCFDGIDLNFCNRSGQILEYFRSRL